MTKNEYVASIMLEAAELLKEDAANKKDVDTAGRRNSYNIARQCVSQIQNVVTRSCIKVRVDAFDLFVKLSNPFNEVTIAIIENIDDDKSRIIRNIVYDANEKMPNGYYLKAVNHSRPGNKISVRIYLRAEK